MDEPVIDFASMSTSFPAVIPESPPPEDSAERFLSFVPFCTSSRTSVTLALCPDPPDERPTVRFPLDFRMTSFSAVNATVAFSSVIFSILMVLPVST